MGDGCSDQDRPLSYPEAPASSSGVEKDLGVVSADTLTCLYSEHGR